MVNILDYMKGVDVEKAVRTADSINQLRRNRELHNARMQEFEFERERKNILQEARPAAYQGDLDAMRTLHTYAPQEAMNVFSMHEAQRQAQLQQQEQRNMSNARLAYAVKLAYEQNPQDYKNLNMVYQAALTEAQSLGEDITGAPTEITPANASQVIDKMNMMISKVATAKQIAGEVGDVAPLREMKVVGDKETRADRLEAIAQENIVRGNTRLGNQQMRTARSLRKEQKAETKEIEKDAQKLSDRLDKSGIIDLVDSLETITEIINANSNDVPGVGKTSVVPGLFLSLEGKRLRQSVGTLRNAILKARSGGAVTPAEAERLLEEIGIGVGRTDEQLKIGISNVIKTFQNKLGNIQGGHRPKAVNLLTERTGFNIFNRINNLELLPTPTEAAAELAKRKREKEQGI